MKFIAITHSLIFATWLFAVLAMALGVATLGNEESMLSRERGEGLRERRMLIERQDQLRAQLQTEARGDRLQLAVRELGLALEAPPRGRPSASANLPFELASYRAENNAP